LVSLLSFFFEYGDGDCYGNYLGSGNLFHYNYEDKTTYYETYGDREGNGIGCGRNKDYIGYFIEFDR
jgi:hypothetical protein